MMEVARKHGFRANSYGNNGRAPSVFDLNIFSSLPGLLKNLWKVVRVILTLGVQPRTAADLPSYRADRLVGSAQ